MTPIKHIPDLVSFFGEFAGSFPTPRRSFPAEHHQGGGSLDGANYGCKSTGEAGDLGLG